MDLIFGLWQLDGTTVQTAILHRMAACVVPAAGRSQALSLHQSGQIGFGRISLGRAAEEVPVTQAQGLTCLSDARLYRIPGVANPLDLSAAARETRLAALFRAHGDAFPNEVEGDFTCALWDPGQERLTLVRDHAGVRPLFYVHRPGRFLAWASLPEILLGSGLVENRLDRDAAIESFVSDIPGDERTLVQGMMRLPAAHLMHVTGQGLVKTRYWSLKARHPIRDTGRFEDCAAELRRLLDAAVRRRLPQGDGIGAHLSGGLDSTAISVLAARALSEQGRPLHSYSFVAEMRRDVRFVDERPYVDATVQGEPNIYNTKITHPYAPRGARAHRADRLNSTGGPEERVLEAATRDGVDVVLSGWGGDEIVTFNGRGAYAEHFMRLRWQTLWQEVKDRAALYNSSAPNVFYGEVLGYLLPDRVDKAIRRALGRDQNPMANERLAGFLRTGVRNRLARRDITLGADTRANRLALFNNGHIAHSLESYALQGAAHGLSYTYPLLDRDLLEYAIRLPASFFLRKGVRRAVFREAMRDVLPESVRTRRPKLAPFPCALLRAAENRADHLAEIAEFRGDAELDALLDFDAIAGAVADMEGPDAVKAAFNDEADGGTGTAMSPMLYEAALEFAQFLKDRRHGCSDDGKPGAA